MARPPNTGVKSSSKPDELADDVILRLEHGLRYAGWLPLIRQLLNEYQVCFGPLPDKFLATIARSDLMKVLESMSKGIVLWSKSRDKREHLIDEITTLWARHQAEHERAVINGDAAWFNRQADAITRGLSPLTTTKGRFDAAVLRKLNWSALFHGGRPHVYLLGGRTGCTAQDILDSLETSEGTFVDNKQVKGKGKELVVAGHKFRGVRRRSLAVEAIKRLAKQFGFVLDSLETT